MDNIYKYGILQLKDTEETHGLRFTSYEDIERYNRSFDVENYEIIYTDEIHANKEENINTLLEELYVEYNSINNTERKENGRGIYYGTSLSVSDIIAIQNTDSSEINIYYVDDIGFKELDSPLSERLLHNFLDELTLQQEYRNGIESYRMGVIKTNELI